MPSDIQHLMLIGGGHTHALVLKRLLHTPLENAHITLVNPQRHAIYSGMLPGFIAGHYPRQALEIDLDRLAARTEATLVIDKACDIDTDNRRVKLHKTGWQSYDVASLDIGITNAMPAIDGFTESATPAKPFDVLAKSWPDFVVQMRNGAATPHVVVIGAGIAGVELAFAMRHALASLTLSAEITILEAGAELSGVSERTALKLQQYLTEQDIALKMNTSVVSVTDEGCQTEGGQHFKAGFVLGTAGAAPHPWLKNTRLPLHDGFVTVGPDLRVQGQVNLFAVADCAHMVHAPRPKAGVFAVRAAPILAHNIRGALEGGTMQHFHPQRDYLKLISLGRKSALAERFGHAWSGTALWWLKDRIDRRFMAQFQD